MSSVYARSGENSRNSLAVRCEMQANSTTMDRNQAQKTTSVPPLDSFGRQVK